jgi:hypothetical protein
MHDGVYEIVDNGDIDEDEGYVFVLMADAQFESAVGEIVKRLDADDLRVVINTVKNPEKFGFNYEQV